MRFRPLFKTQKIRVTIPLPSKRFCDVITPLPLTQRNDESSNGWKRATKTSSNAGWCRKQPKCLVYCGTVKRYIMCTLYWNLFSKNLTDFFKKSKSYAHTISPFFPFRLKKFSLSIVFVNCLLGKIEINQKNIKIWSEHSSYYMEH